MRYSCVNTLIFGSLWVTFAVHAAPPIQAALEPSAFLDTESSTRFAFTAASDRAGEFRYSLTFEANASNNVQIAFGTDTEVLPMSLMKQRGDRHEISCYFHHCM